MTIFGSLVRNYSHRSFLDGAWKRDMDIIVGLSDWGFIQGPDPCDRYACLGMSWFMDRSGELPAESWYGSHDIRLVWQEWL